MHHMTLCLRGFPFSLRAIMLVAMLTAATGCTSALTTASLRGLPWDTVEQKADVGDDTAAVASNDDADESDALESPVDSDARRAAAIEEAISRLSKVGSLDEQAQATLMATLHNTAPEDWPVVIAEFATALAKAGTAAAAVPHVVAKADLAPPASAPEAAAPEPPAPAASVTAAVEAAADDTSSPLPVAAPEPLPPHDPVAPAEPDPSVSIRTACFASRVQAWGVFDRFPADRFAPGQEVIVYVELDDLAATTAADRHRSHTRRHRRHRRRRRARRVSSSRRRSRTSPRCRSDRRRRRRSASGQTLVNRPRPR